MKRGDKVWVCQDGKFNRRIEGTVIKTRQGHHICVDFPFEAEEGNKLDCIFWVRMSPCAETYKTYSGWAEHDWIGWCPWYTVMKQSDSQCFEDERIVSQWQREQQFENFKKRGSNGKHRWNTKPSQPVASI